MRFATWIISGKYRIDGRNFSCISHKKNAVVLDTNFPSLLVAILKGCNIDGGSDAPLINDYSRFSECKNCYFIYK